MKQREQPTNHIKPESGSTAITMIQNRYKEYRKYGEPEEVAQMVQAYNSLLQAAFEIGHSLGYETDEIRDSFLDNPSDTLASLREQQLESLQKIQIFTHRTSCATRCERLPRFAPTRQNWPKEVLEMINEHLQDLVLVKAEWKGKPTSILAFLYEQEGEDRERKVNVTPVALVLDPNDPEVYENLTVDGHKMNTPDGTSEERVQ